MARRDTILVSRTLYQMAIITVIGAVCWVGITVYHALVQPPDINVSESVLSPISPVIDQSTIASLSGRLSIQADLSQNATISGVSVNGVK